MRRFITTTKNINNMSLPDFSICSFYNETDDDEYAGSKNGNNPMNSTLVNGNTITILESGIKKKMRYENNAFYISYGLKTYILHFELLVDFDRLGNTINIYSEDITLLVKASNIDDSRAIEYLLCRWFE